MELVPGALLGSYRLVERAGAGGMAEVWKAYQPRLDRFVAIKVLARHLAGEPGFIERFEREARAVSRLEHPNILVVFDFGEQDDCAYMVMPFIGGGTLAQHLGRIWPVMEVARLLGPLAGALDYAHARGVVHRDVKPANVLLASDGRVVLADFGVARLFEQSQALTGTGALIGTPAYMAPEQVAGRPAAPASDQYSLGVVLYQLLTGRVPFEAETPIAVAFAHLHGALPPPRSLNSALAEVVEAVLLKALAKEPAERYPSCRALAEALVAAEPTLVPPPLPASSREHDRAGLPTARTERAGSNSAEVPAPAPRRVGPRRWVVAPVVVVVAIVALLITIVWPRMFAPPVPAASPQPTSPPVTAAMAVSPLPAAGSPSPAAAPRPPPTSAAGSLQTPPSMSVGRSHPAAVLLADGRVLVSGGETKGRHLASAELFDSTTNAWTSAATMETTRRGHTATLLPGGQVLVSGGYSSSTADGLTASAERYDPTNNSWTSAGAMARGRFGHTATLLPTGQVLVVGGFTSGNVLLETAERYDPATNAWSPIGSLAQARGGHTATLLPGGQVLIVGGITNGGAALATAERFDPSGSWSRAPSMAVPRAWHAATLLPGGQLLISGGGGGSGGATAELLGPAAEAWREVGRLSVPRWGHTATLLGDGQVLIAGGEISPSQIHASAERFDPSTERWAEVGAMNAARAFHAATLLTDGQPLLVGGFAGGEEFLPSAERYSPTTNTWARPRQ